MTGDPFAHNFDDEDGPRERRLADLFSEYARRIEAGEELDGEEIRRLHPDLASDLLRDLQSFETVGADLSPAEPLGAVGDYTLRRQIGRGGMGVVYEAWENSMDRRVALKVLPAGFAADPRACARFLREAQTAGKLSHPNVVPVFFTGIKDQTPFYAMEYVEGETIAQIVAGLKRASQGAPTPFGPKDGAAHFENVSRAFAEVADGLQHAHSNGVVHRDVKPSNLILEAPSRSRPGGGNRARETDLVGSPDSGSTAEGASAPRLRILDFGLARLEGQESLSASGDVVGTPLYMSPEQARRSKIAIDHRTDIYSLGATLYELLTLEPPFRGKDHEETLSQIVGRDPCPPRQRNPRVPQDLETIVLKCLRKDPGDRYGTAEALGQDLRRFVRGDPIEARPQAAWEKAVRRAWRARAWLSLAATTILFLAAAGLLLVGSYRDARKKAEGEYRKVVLEAAWALDLGQHEARDLSVYVRLVQETRPVVSQSAPSRRDPLLASIQDLKGAVARFPRRPDAPYHLARALLLERSFPEALGVLDRLLEWNPRFVPALHLKARALVESGEADSARAWSARTEEVADSGWSRAWLAAQRAVAEERWTDAVPAFDSVLDLLSEGEFYLGSSIELRLAGARAAIRAGDFNRAIHVFAAAEALWPESLLPGLFLGKIYCMKGEREEADRIFRRLHDRTRSRDSRAADDLAIAIGNLHGDDLERGLPWFDRVVGDRPMAQSAKALSLYWGGRVAEARECAEKAVEGAPGHPVALAALALICNNTGRSEEATLYARRSLESGLGHVLRDYWYPFMLSLAGRPEEAAAECRRILEVDPADPAVLNLLADLERKRGKLQEAERSYRQAIEHSPRQGTPRVPMENLADFLEEQGRLQEAESLHLQAVAQAPQDPEGLLHLGAWYRRRGKLEDAVKAFRGSMSLEPRWDAPVLALGEALEAQGKPAEAFAAYLGSVSLGAEGQEGEGHRSLIRLHRRSGSGDVLAASWDALVDTLEGEAGEGGDAGKSGGNFRLLNLLALGRIHGPERRDLRRAREHVDRALEAGGGSDPDVIATLAEAQALEGHVSEGVLTLERALALPGADRALERELEAMRVSALPDLPSIGSVDAAVRRTRQEPAARPELLARLRDVAAGPDALLRVAYLEARIEAGAGRPAEAASRLAAILDSGAASALPLATLARVLAAAGRAAEAQSALREAIAGAGEESRDLWDLWVSVCLDDLKMAPGDALASMPRASGYGEDIAWLLEALRYGAGIRIRCGGPECRDSKGRVWGKDRFYLGGTESRDAEVDVEGTDDPVLYRRERWFPRGARALYRIPLPCGNYRITLHSSEVFLAPGSRRFDVRIGGKEILPDYEPPFRKADAKEFPVSVEAGILEIELLHRLENPKLSAIEISGPDP